MALGQLSPSRVRSWNAALAKSHPVVAAKAYRLLSSMMRAAVADEVIVRNPCQVKSAGTERGPERPLATVAEVAALANAMPANLRLAVLVAAWCQLRRAELLGLRRRDVDLLHRTLTVEVTKTTMMSGKAVVKAPKTDAGRRTIAIPSHVIPELETHLTEQRNTSPVALTLGCFRSPAGRSTGRGDRHEAPSSVQTFICMTSVIQG